MQYRTLVARHKGTKKTKPLCWYRERAASSLSVVTGDVIQILHDRDHWLACASILGTLYMALVGWYHTSSSCKLSTVHSYVFAVLGHESTEMNMFFTFFCSLQRIFRLFWYLQVVQEQTLALGEVGVRMVIRWPVVSGILGIKNYWNLFTLFQVTIDNVGDVFLTFLFIPTPISCVSISPGSAGADVGWGGNLNGRLMASCVRNIRDAPKIIKIC